MSTKTVTKRVALATVVALGAGVLSLVSVTSAHAAANPALSATSNVGAANSYLNVAIVSSKTGAPSAASVALATSVGLVTWGDIYGTLTAQIGATATALTNGAVTLYSQQANNQGNLYTVTNGTIQSNPLNLQVNGSLSSAATGSAIGGTAEEVFTVKPINSALPTVVSLYVDTTANETATALLGGTYTSANTSLKATTTITWVAAATTGTVSAAKSGVWYTGTTNAGGQSQGLTSDSVTLSSPGALGVSGDGYANIRVRDAYGNAVSGPGLLQASATNGAIVNLGNSTSALPGAGTASTAFAAILGSGSPDNYLLDVEAPTSAPVNTVVTVTYNGTVIGTKSYSFGGNIAKITLSSPKNLKTNGNGTATISFADAAGNVVYPTSSQYAADASTFNSVLTGATLSTPPVSGVVGKVTITCGANNGSANLAVKYTNTDGSVIVSNALPVTCSGAPATYSAAYDKTSYNPGDIATLSVTFKDTKGALANDIDTLTTYVAPTVSTAGVTVISGPTAGDATTNGVIKYTYAVGTTSGTFTNTVSFATPDATAKANGLSTGPATATLTINSSGTSLNDVLKGIVSLIASINKQIAALAKLVTKK
jgi:hypothetical protein